MVVALAGFGVGAVGAKVDQCNMDSARLNYGCSTTLGYAGRGSANGTALRVGGLSHARPFQYTWRRCRPDLGTSRAAAAAAALLQRRIDGGSADRNGLL